MFLTFYKKYNRLITMKRTLTRNIEFNGNPILVNFEYWPPYSATLVQPEEGPEINILSISNNDGKSIDVPLISDDGGNGDYEKIVNILLDDVSDEQEAMCRISVEEWD